MDRYASKKPRQRAKAGVADRVKFIEQDLFESKSATTPPCHLYLLPSINVQLRPNFPRLETWDTHRLAQLRMGDWKPEKQVDISGETLYFWHIPARK